MILLFVLVPPAVVIAVAVTVASFLKPRGAHAFADPADTTDPHGEQYVAALRDPADDWPAPGTALPLRIEVSTTPGRLDMLPGDPDPDHTVVQPPDVLDLGPVDKYVDGLFDKHAPKPDVIA